MNSNTTGEINPEIIPGTFIFARQDAMRRDAPGVYDDAQVSSLIRVFLRNL